MYIKKGFKTSDFICLIHTFKSIVRSGRVVVEFDFLLSADLLLVNVIQVWYCVKIVPENSLKVLKSGWIKELLLLKVKKLKFVRWDFIEIIEMRK